MGRVSDAVRLMVAFAVGACVMGQWAEPPSAQAAVSELNGHPVAPSNDGLYYVDAIVNGKTVRFLVDTGATNVMLSAVDARRLGLEKSLHFKHPVQTAGGIARLAWTELSRMTVAGRSFDEVPAGVLQSGGVSLMGQDVLSRFEIVSMSNRELRLR